MNEIIEEWKPIVGYEGLYEVSNLGKVKSLIDNNRKPREKILKQGKNKYGYMQVILCKDGKLKHCIVHRLVAKAFIDNPNNYPCVNHIDENKENNCVDNLEWCTYQYNLNYGTCQQRRVANTDYKAIADKIDYQEISRKVAEKLINRQDLSKQVFQYTKNGTLVAIWKSTAECGRNGFDQGAVASCCRSERKSHKGYIWSYIPL